MSRLSVKYFIRTVRIGAPGVRPYALGVRREERGRGAVGVSCCRLSTLDSGHSTLLGGLGDGCGKCRLQNADCRMNRDAAAAITNSALRILHSSRSRLSTLDSGHSTPAGRESCGLRNEGGTGFPIPTAGSRLSTLDTRLFGGWGLGVVSSDHLSADHGAGESVGRNTEAQSHTEKTCGLTRARRIRRLSALRVSVFPRSVSADQERHGDIQTERLEAA